MPKIIDITGELNLGTREERVRIILVGIDQGWGNLTGIPLEDGGWAFIFTTKLKGQEVKTIRVLDEDMEYMLEQNLIEKNRVN